MANSGLAFAKYLLSLDASTENGQRSDHYGEAWAGFFDQTEHSPPELTSGEVNGSIEDERGKFPVNSLIGDTGTINPEYRNILNRLLRYPPYSLEETKAETIVQSLLDWLDPDDLPTGEFGAESATYRAEGKGYACPNADMKALAELAKIRGISRELLAGDRERPGLMSLLSVHNPGKININTAPPLLLAAMVLPTVSPETAADFAESAVSYRRDKEHFEFLGEKDWYRNRMAGFNDIQLPSRVVATTSHVYAVTVKAGTGRKSKALFAVVQRDGQGRSSLKTLWREVH